MQLGTMTCERCGVPRGEGDFCANCRVLNADPGAGHYAGSGARRLMARLLDLVLFALTLGLGWWIWLGVTSGQGQSPAKRLLGLRVVRADGSPMSAGAVWFRDGVLALLLTPLLPISILWALRSSGRQALHDVLAGSVVVNAESRPVPGHVRQRQAPANMTARSRPPRSRQRDMPPPVRSVPTSKPASEPARSSTPQTASPGARTSRSRGPARSKTPEASGSTRADRSRAGQRPASRAPERAGSDRAHQQLPDKKPMWPGGVPPWEQGESTRTPGDAPPPSAAERHADARPQRAPQSQRPSEPLRWPDSAPAGRAGNGIQYSNRAHTTMDKIAELEQMFRGGQLNRADFENERRRLIAES